MERHSVARLIGAPPGYVGYDEGGQLTEAVRRRPYSVILFDEVKKAHPDVFNILLQILEDGRLSDGQGHTVDFRNSVVIMTSNVGAREAMKGRTLGFAAPDEGAGFNWEKIRDGIMENARKVFRPEFLNRIDEIIVFKPLDRGELLRIVDHMLLEVEKRLKEQSIFIEVPPEARTLLLEKGYDPKYGARPLRRTLQRMIEDKLADLLLEGGISSESSVKVRVSEGELTFETTGGEDKPVS
ncbi:MAG: AAA family ATPase, partial [Synergistota bacterium]|nr:AAA family ATPase [Synergistota bacterium]